MLDFCFSLLICKVEQWYRGLTFPCSGLILSSCYWFCRACSLRLRGVPFRLCIFLPPPKKHACRWIVYVIWHHGVVRWTAITSRVCSHFTPSAMFVLPPYGGSMATHNFVVSNTDNLPALSILVEILITSMISSHLIEFLFQALCLKKCFPHLVSSLIV